MWAGPDTARGSVVYIADPIIPIDELLELGEQHVICEDLLRADNKCLEVDNITREHVQQLQKVVIHVPRLKGAFGTLKEHQLVLGRGRTDRLRRRSSLPSVMALEVMAKLRHVLGVLSKVRRARERRGGSLVAGKCGGLRVVLRWRPGNTWSLTRILSYR